MAAMTGQQQFTDNALAYAERAFGQGNLSAVDLLVNGVLSVAPGNARALGLMSLLRTRLRLREEGAGWAQEIAAGAGGQPRYMLIKAWGYGYWADVCHVAGALLVAEMTGRIPVVHWGANSRFRAGSGDAWHLYWRTASDASLADVRAAARGGIWPPKWTPDNLEEENVGKWEGIYSRLGAVHYLNRPEPVVVSDFYMGLVDVVPWLPPAHPLHGRSLPAVHAELARTRLVPSAAVSERVEAFRARYLSGGGYLAVHVRGSDKHSEFSDIDQLNAQVVQIVDGAPASMPLFVLTEDARQLAYMRARYGDRVISTDVQRAEGDVNLPFQQDHEVDRVALGFEVMLDTYLAMTCDRFLGNGRSNVSNIVALFKAWPPGACHIIEPLLLLERNFSLHLLEAEIKV